MLNTMTLGRLRLVVQLLMLFLTVWGSQVVGYYAAEKISGTLPALSCAYDKQNGAYCMLIPLQHQLHHRVGEGLVAAQQFSLQILLPLLFTVLTFLAFFVVLNKAFCGWVCPLGTLQELAFRLGRRLGLPVRRLETDQAAKARPVKWLLLVTLVLALPLMAGLGLTPHATGDAWCQVCPSRIATTLLTADTEQTALKTDSTLEFALGAAANTLLGFTLVAALALRQPFCRICPLLAWNALFQKIGLLRLVKRQHDKCGKCRVCSEACPMDIEAISKEHGGKAFTEDCTLCGRCAEYCPEDGVIALKFGPVALFRSSRAYYKRRVQGEKPNGESRPVKFHVKSVGPGHG